MQCINLKCLSLVRVRLRVLSFGFSPQLVSSSGGACTCKDGGLGLVEGVRTGHGAGHAA
jgi:hypothetical protein